MNSPLLVPQGISYVCCGLSSVLGAEVPEWAQYIKTLNCVYCMSASLWIWIEAEKGRKGGGKGLERVLSALTTLTLIMHHCVMFRVTLQLYP